MEDTLVPIVAIVSHSTPFLLLIFAVVAVAVLAVPLRRWIAIKERQAEHAPADMIERAAQTAARTERLEQRVAVLERILTDRGTHLADEIEQLRDRPLN